MRTFVDFLKHVVASATFVIVLAKLKKNQFWIPLFIEKWTKLIHAHILVKVQVSSQYAAVVVWNANFPMHAVVVETSGTCRWLGCYNIYV